MTIGKDEEFLLLYAGHTIRTKSFLGTPSGDPRWVLRPMGFNDTERGEQSSQHIR
jgi:hypothetical protein